MITYGNVNMVKKIAVIGAGVVGLPCAYRLQKELNGVEVGFVNSVRVRLTWSDCDFYCENLRDKMRSVTC